MKENNKEKEQIKSVKGKANGYLGAILSIGERTKGNRIERI